MPRRRFPLRVTQVSGSLNLGIQLPPVGSSGSGACECEIEGLVWGSTGDLEMTATAGEAAAVIVVDGTICPDTEFTFDTDWTPDDPEGSEPTIEDAGAGAWRVVATDAGTLVLTPSGTCGGESFSFEALTLTVEPGEAPWVNILTIEGVSAVYDEDDYSDDGDVFIRSISGSWDGTSTGGITFTGLQAYFGDADMDYRATCTDDIEEGMVGGEFLVDQMTNPTVGQQIEGTFANGDIPDFFTGAGLFSGEIDAASLPAKWRIEVRPAAA